MSLWESFSTHWHGAAGAPPEALEQALEALHAEGRSAHPDVPLPASDLAAHAGARAAVDVGALEAIQSLRAADLFLACACVRGVPQAHAAFDRLLVKRLPAYLSRFRSSPEIVVETRQALLERLFVPPSPGDPPRMAQYSGRGALDAWVRVAALRVALQIVERRREPAGDEAALAGVVDRADDPELGFLKASLRAPFAAAFREALAAAPARTRTLLDLAFVEGLPRERIGQLYGVHRTTAIRWIDEARAEILAAVRARLLEHHHLSPSECDELFQLVHSQVDLTLSSLLARPGQRAKGA